ncbi:MAG: hypothetical protein ACO1SV_04850 [Fimbriimonas sp.]
MVVVAILSLLCALVGIGLAYGGLRVIRLDTGSSIYRERFFNRFFRFFAGLACLAGSALLFKAAWIIWFNPLSAALYVLAVPLFAFLLLLLAKGILPWLYRRTFKK